MVNTILASKTVADNFLVWFVKKQLKYIFIEWNIFGWVCASYYIINVEYPITLWSRKMSGKKSTNIRSINNTFKADICIKK